VRPWLIADGVARSADLVPFDPIRLRPPFAAAHQLAAMPDRRNHAQRALRMPRPT
jgi:hypothetical protein